MTLRGGLLTWDGTPRDLALLDPRICDCCQTGAAVTDEGVVAVYRGRTEGEIRDILAVRMVDGAWDTPAPIHDDGWEIGACPVNGPRWRPTDGASPRHGSREPGTLPGCGSRSPTMRGPPGPRRCRWTRARPWAGWTSSSWRTGAPWSSGSKPPTTTPRSWPAGCIRRRLDPAEPLALTRQVRASGFPRMAGPGTGSCSPGPSPPPSGAERRRFGRRGLRWGGVDRRPDDPGSTRPPSSGGCPRPPLMFPARRRDPQRAA
jgi:hypothetical protein